MSQQPTSGTDGPRYFRFPDLLLLAAGPRAEGRGVEETVWENRLGQPLSFSPWLCIWAADIWPGDCALEGSVQPLALLGERRVWPGQGREKAGLRLEGRMPGLEREQLEGVE